MKRNIVILFLFLFLAHPLSAQFHLGIEAGANVNSVSFSKDVWSSENRLGFFVGPKLCAIIRPLGIGIDAAALYSHKTAAIVTTTATSGINTHDTELNYIEVPINLRWNIGSEHLGIYMATGPQFAWFVGDRTISDIYNDRQTVFESNLFSWNVGAGVMLFRHIQLGATYNIPVKKAGTIRDSFTQTVDGENIKYHTWQIHLNYFF